MTAGSADEGHWSRRRWWIVITLLAALQVGMVFWVGEKNAVEVARLKTGPRLVLPRDLREITGLEDPTLNVLPNNRSFSGPAWLQPPVLSFQWEPWTEPPRPLELAANDLGNPPAALIASGTAPLASLVDNLEPRWDSLSFFPTAALAKTRSTLSVEDELAGRPLLSRFKLVSRESPDLLASTEVQVAVNAQGRVVSAVLLAKSGDPKHEADTNALALAQAAVFQAAPDGRPGALTWGRMVFHWHTVPPPAVPAAK